jgi:hypothetical protein
MAATPLINGINYSWRDVTLMLFGVPVIGITEVSYSSKQTKTNEYGWGSEPISRGYGNVEYSGSITLFLDEWKNIISAAPNSDPKQIPFFDIQVVYGPSRAGSSTDVLQACEFMEDKIDLKQGEGKFLVQIPLIIGGIIHK